MAKKPVRRTLTEREREFVEAYERNAGNIPLTCRQLNITTARAAHYMQSKLVKERLSRSVEVAKERITSAAPHLVNLALQIVNDEEVSVKVRAQMIASLLDRAGVTEPKAPLVAINVNTQIADRAREILAGRLGGKDVADPAITPAIPAPAPTAIPSHLYTPDPSSANTQIFDNQPKTISIDVEAG